jgi:hypothetical protein
MIVHVDVLPVYLLGLRSLLQLDFISLFAKVLRELTH